MTVASTVFGGQGDEVIDGRASAGPNFLSGDLGDDSIMGGSGADTIYGGGGADTLIGGTGVEALYGNGGNDVIRMQASGTMFGGQGDDILTATDTGAHYVSGDLGDDTITSAGRAGDTLYGARATT